VLAAVVGVQLVVLAYFFGADSDHLRLDALLRLHRCRGWLLVKIKCALLALLLRLYSEKVRTERWLTLL
jgi:hypothetical protein